MKRIFVAALLAVVAGAAGFALHFWTHGGTAVRRPDFTLRDLDNRTRSLAEWDGKVVLINFWAPWCGPCRKEMPMLVQLQKDLGAKGFQILGLALDEPENVRKFAAALGVNYPVLVGMEDITRIEDAYGDSSLPYSVLVDRKGMIIFEKAGEISRAEIEAAIQPLL